MYHFDIQQKWYRNQEHFDPRNEWSFFEITMIVIWFLHLFYQMTRKVGQNEPNRQSIMIFKVKWSQAQNDLQPKWTFFLLCNSCNTCVIDRNNCVFSVIGLKHYSVPFFEKGKCWKSNDIWCLVQFVGWLMINCTIVGVYIGPSLLDKSRMRTSISAAPR